MLGSVHIQTNYTAGEISPYLYGRIDLSKYHNALSRLKNMIIMPHGGIYRRSGTRYVADVKDHTKKVRLVDFEFSTTQAYVIEFGHLYCRFYRNEGRIESPPGTPVEITTPYTEADLNTLKFTQSADTLYIVHPSYEPRKITRSSHTSWTITIISFTANPFVGAGNFPRAVALYEERSVWAGTNNDPQTVRFSRIGDFEDMTTGALDDDGLEYVIASDQVNVVLWMSAGDTLLIGTTGSEFEAHGSTPDQPITPSAVQINRQSRHGSADATALKIGNQVLFIQRAGRKILELFYSLEVDGFVAPDMTIMSNHLMRPGLLSMAHQQEPHNLVWAITNNGKLLAMTYYRPEDVVGWQEHVVGGTDVEVESITTIPSPNGDHDQLWASIKRTINGATKRYVEFFEQVFYDDDNLEDAFFVDSGLSYDGSPATTISGLDHLEGETVSILADGAVVPDQTVSSGQITLSDAASKVHAGLQFQSLKGSLRIEPTLETAQGKISRAHQLIIRFHDTVGGKIGPDENNLIDIATYQDGIVMGDPPSRFTGDLSLPFDGNYTFSMQNFVEQSLPLPMTILSDMVRYKVSPDD